MDYFQPGILQALPAVGRYLFFDVDTPELLSAKLLLLTEQCDGDSIVVGIGAKLIAALGGDLAELHDFPTDIVVLPNRTLSLPSTPSALFCWLRGDDPGELFLRTEQLVELLMPALVLTRVVDGFVYAQGRDLTGYVDGTENPVDAAAIATAFVANDSSSLAGSSFVAVQQWQHDFARFNQYSPDQQDDMVGRRKLDNEELSDAPESAHVKRTAQEDFTPEAFLLRRSMPWVEGTHAGLMFVGFGHSLQAFEVQMRRMMGVDDGIVDALFQISTPISGAYFWCPGLREGKLNLAALGL